MSQNRIVIEDMESYFGPIYEYVMDDEVTDIDYSAGLLFLTTSSNDRYRCRQTVLSDSFVEEFTRRVSNTVSKQFNKNYPILEAETDTLRITIVHESVAKAGRTISIRKSMPLGRMTEESMIESRYTSRDILELLKRCVTSKLNMVFCGEPGVGKTECAKFFSGYIPENERVITIEDTPEWHYSSIRPSADCVELRINDMMDYTSAIKTCLRLNPKWLMLSEARSKEVVYLIEGFSTGVRGMTTLHADDVECVPDRMVNMAGGGRNEARLENDIFSFLDVAVLIRRRAFEEEERTVVRRYIDQVGFFYRTKGENKTFVAVSDGVMSEEAVPPEILKKLGAEPAVMALGQRERELEVKRVMEDFTTRIASVQTGRGTYLGQTKAFG